MSQGTVNGVPIDTDPTMALNSNQVVPSQASVVTYVGARSTPTGASGKMLQGNGVGNVPVYSTSTYPATNAVSTLLYASATDTVNALATANNGMLVTSATGVPSILAGPGATGKVLQSNAVAAPSFQLLLIQQLQLELEKF